MMKPAARILRPAASLLARRFSATEFSLTSAQNNIPMGMNTKPPMSAHIWRWYRREPISQAQVQAEMEEEAKNIDLAPHKLLQKGDEGTQQAIIQDVIPVGYFCKMPSGKQAYLPAQDLGFTGGLAILERLFKVGQEITVRVASIGGGGREILSIKKPEFAPPERKFSVSASTASRAQGSRY